MFLFTSFLTQKLNQYKKDVFTVKSIGGDQLRLRYVEKQESFSAKISTIVPNERKEKESGEKESERKKKVRGKSEGEPQSSVM